MWMFEAHYDCLPARVNISRNFSVKLSGYYQHMVKYLGWIQDLKKRGAN